MKAAASEPFLGSYSKEPIDSKQETIDQEMRELSSVKGSNERSERKVRKMQAVSMKDEGEESSWVRECF